jgi:hypothetical protein
MIYDEGDVPAAFAADIALNRRAFEKDDEYHVPVNRLLRGASAEEVERNRAKCLLAAQVLPGFVHQPPETQNSA